MFQCWESALNPLTVNRHPRTTQIHGDIDYITWDFIFNFTNIYGLISMIFCSWVQIVLIVVFTELIGSMWLIDVILLVLEPPLRLLWNIRLAEIYLGFI